MPIEQTHGPLKLDDALRAELLRRAYAAWFKSGGTAVPTERSCVKIRKGLAYVVLHGAEGVLTVYRVRADNLALRRMVRPPAGVVN